MSDHRWRCGPLLLWASDRSWSAHWGQRLLVWLRDTRRAPLLLGERERSHFAGLRMWRCGPWALRWGERGWGGAMTEPDFERCGVVDPDDGDVCDLEAGHGSTTHHAYDPETATHAWWTVDGSDVLGLRDLGERVAYPAEPDDA